MWQLGSVTDRREGRVGRGAELSREARRLKAGLLAVKRPRQHPAWGRAPRVLPRLAAALCPLLAGGRAAVGRAVTSSTGLVLNPGTFPRLPAALG